MNNNEISVQTSFFKEEKSSEPLPGRTEYMFVDKNHFAVCSVIYSLQRWQIASIASELDTGERGVL